VSPHEYLIGRQDKMNQFVMMRDAEFHSQSFLNNTLVGSFDLFCDNPDGHSLRKIVPAHVMPLTVNDVPMSHYFICSLRKNSFCEQRNSLCSIVNRLDWRHHRRWQMDVEWIFNCCKQSKKRTQRQ
jgi:hypothetical protein